MERSGFDAVLRTRGARAGVVTVVLALAPFSLHAQATQRLTLTGGDLAVWNIVGSIRVEGGQGSTTEVEVTRRGPDAARLTVESGRLRGRETVRVIYPDRRIVFRDESRVRRWVGDMRVQLYVDEDGTFGEGGGGRSRGERVEIRSSGSGLEAWADVVLRVPRGRRLDINLAAGQATVMNVDGEVSVDVQAATVTTSGTRGSLNLDTGSGEVSVSDADGELTLDTGSGSVTLTRIKGPSITLDTGSGGIRGSGLDADELSLDTGSGSVELRGVRAKDVGLDTGSGSVELQLVSDVDRLMVDSGSGSVTIGVPEALGAMVTVEASSGGIDFDFPITVTKRSRRFLSGQLGDGRGRIEVGAGSGSVRFRRS